MDFLVNGRSQAVPDEAVDPSMPLLWALRDVLNLTGTKYGCGVGACGACSVHLGDEVVRSCVTPLSAVRGRPVTTIEGLASADRPHPLQEAWVLHQVPQCGYCQSGMLMAAAALLKRNKRPTAADVDAAITNLCRCGTYPRIRAGILTAAALLRGEAVPGMAAQPAAKAARA